MGVKRMQRRLQRRLALSLAALFLAWIVLAGDQGLLALALTWKERFSLQAEIHKLGQHNLELVHQIRSLEQERVFYEKVAREKLMLQREGEWIYRFERN